MTRRKMSMAREIAQTSSANAQEISFYCCSCLLQFFRFGLGFFTAAFF